MSKCIKLEDAEKLLTNALRIAQGFDEPLERSLVDLPTIEVSEEVLKATKKFNAYTIADENAEMGMRTQIEPIIEVSEDCISREWVLQMLTTYEKDRSSANELDEWQNRVVEWIEMDIKDAPSVAPKARPIEMHLDVTDDVVDRAVEKIRAEGEWQITEAYPHNVYCSKCHKKFAQTHWAVWEDGSLPRNYCPNCGAKMRLE